MDSIHFPSMATILANPSQHLSPGQLPLPFFIPLPTQQPAQSLKNSDNSVSLLKCSQGACTTKLVEHPVKSAACLHFSVHTVPFAHYMLATLALGWQCLEKAKFLPTSRPLHCSPLCLESSCLGVFTFLLFQAGFRISISQRGLVQKHHLK